MRKKHPLLRNNYIPRLIACCWFIVTTSTIHWPNLLVAEVLWLYPIALLWPHLAYYLGTRSGKPKRQEITNMKFDALCMGAVLACSPELLYAGMLLTIISVNGIMIGAFRLLSIKVSLFALGFLLTRMFVDVPFSSNAGMATTLAVLLFFLVYFNSFGYMGYVLTRNLIRLNKEIRELSDRDGLTGCFNRMYLDKYLRVELRRCQRLNYPLTMIFADLDNFKQINDSYGHHIGDAVLRHFVDIAGQCIRDDIDWLARFGGEEFIIVLANADIENGARVAERIRRKLASTALQMNKLQLSVTASFGVSSTSRASEDPDAETLLAQADKSLYSAKSAGRDAVVIFDDSDIEQPGHNKTVL